MADEPFIDPIVEEVRKARDAYAARFDYDLDKIVEDLQRRQAESGRTYVKLPPKRVKPSDQRDTPRDAA